MKFSAGTRLLGDPLARDIVSLGHRLRLLSRNEHRHSSRQSWAHEIGNAGSIEVNEERIVGNLLERFRTFAEGLDIRVVHENAVALLPCQLAHDSQLFQVLHGGKDRRKEKAGKFDCLGSGQDGVLS